MYGVLHIVHVMCGHSSTSGEVQSYSQTLLESADALDVLFVQIRGELSLTGKLLDRGLAGVAQPHWHADKSAFVWNFNAEKLRIHDVEFMRSNKLLQAQYIIMRPQ